MGKIQLCIQNLANRTIESEDPARKVIELIHENGIDWMHACGKKGRCTTCKMSILAGQENLSPESEREKAFKAQQRLLPHERLACQAQLLQGNLVVRVAEQNKFPHLSYTD